jgi:hypothetical protein
VAKRLSRQPLGSKTKNYYEGNMDIPTQEYQERRHIFDYCRWINQTLRTAEHDANFEELYFERTSANWKKLLEEAIPVSRLGLYLCHEWNDVFVQCSTDNPSFDAIIEVINPSDTRFSGLKIKVEVTTTENDQSVMKRQAISRNGFVVFTGNSRREGRKIITEGEMVDVEDECEKTVQLAIQRFEAKIGNKYDDSTAILVYVVSRWHLLNRHRYNLIEAIKRILCERNPTLYGAFVCYSSNQGIDGVVISQDNYSM